MRLTLMLAALISLPAPTNAAGKIGYGSRVGMEVSVISMSGIDTARAMIRTKHTREDAITFCREYVGKVTPDCIKEELAVPLNDSISANCRQGNFVDFGGSQYRFAGEARGKATDTKYILYRLPSRQPLDGSTASGYPTALAIFKALCPSSVPDAEF